MEKTVSWEPEEGEEGSLRGVQGERWIRQGGPFICSISGGWRWGLGQLAPCDKKEVGALRVMVVP